MDLHDALRQITDIRLQMSRCEVFRGYRSATIGFSGALGILAASFQSHWVAEPSGDLTSYLVLWVGVALVSASVAGFELAMRSVRSESGLQRAMTRSAIEQFLPCLAVGALLTLLIYQHAQQVAWMLPGLWAILFGLGIFASRHLLPPQVIVAGLYYVVSGLACLRFGQQSHAFSPWQMAVSFGGGQLLCAAIIYWTLERKHGA